MASQKKFYKIQGTVSTSGLTTATLCSFTVPANASYSVLLKAIGRETNGDTIIANKKAASKRVSGTLSVVGAVLDIGADILDAALTGAVVTIDSSGDDIRARVTGIALKDIEWQGEMEIHIN